MAFFDWSKQLAWSQGAWSPGAWLSGAFAAGAWKPKGPTNTAPPGVIGALALGSALTWFHGNVVVEQRDDQLHLSMQRKNANIPGATAATYQIAAADDGNPITCGVTAADSVGTTIRTSNTVVPQF
jgi:hypothetical protein